jgi:molecular chaperone GrpE
LTKPALRGPVAVILQYVYVTASFLRSKFMSMEEQPKVLDPQAVEDQGGGTPIPIDPVSPEQIEDLKARAAKADENWDRYVRLNADFDNYKKRAARERQESIRYANESLLEKLIPVLDNFDMAMLAANNPQAGTADSLRTGVNMIHTQLKAAIQEAGLEELSAVGKPFDPHLHEAVSQQESTEVPEGSVLQQLRKGYKLKDRLVRPATVVVAKAPVS